MFCSVVRRAIAAAIGTGAATGAMLLNTAAIAWAAPPNCTAADLAGVASGVSTATSSYLFTHPDVNSFFTSLEGQPKTEIRGKVQDYLNANPQVQADLQGIRAPLTDFRARCTSPG
jgi:hemophore-related protein